MSVKDKQIIVPLSCSELHQSGIYFYAQTLVSALQKAGYDAKIVDTQDIAYDDLSAKEGAKELLAAITDESINPEHKEQIVLFNLPDIQIGFNSVHARFCQEMVEWNRSHDSKIYVSSFVHEFSEAVKRSGPIAAAINSMLYFPLARYGHMATSTPQEYDMLVNGLNTSLGINPVKILAPHLEETDIIPIPSAIVRTDASLVAEQERYATEKPPKIAVFGTFRANKGVDILNEQHNLGMREVVCSISERVKSGTIPEGTTLCFAGNVAQLDKVGAGGENPYQVLHQFIDSFYELNECDVALLYQMHDLKDLEDFILDKPLRVEFDGVNIELMLGRSDAELSQMMGESSAGIILSLRGLSGRNSVLKAFVSHNVPIMANIGDETDSDLLDGIVTLYDDRVRGDIPFEDQSGYTMEPVRCSLV